MAHQVKKIETPAPPGAPPWMLTYSDTISLILTFFVMLLTFSTADQEKFDKAAGGLRGGFASLGEVGISARPSIVADRFSRSGRATAYGFETPPELGPMPWEVIPLDARLKRRLIGTPITAASGRKGFLLRMPSDELFDGNTAVLTEEGLDLIERIASVIRYLPNDIEVAAHTDGTSRGGPGSPADTDLSISRGTAVLKEFEAVTRTADQGTGIEPRRLALSAPGATLPLVDQTDPSAAAKNRRVEIILLRYRH
jgi:chemotaxis protein MotB